MTKTPSKSILVNPVIFSALVAGLPGFFGRAAPTLVMNINDLLYSADFKAGNVEGDFEIIHATDAHSAMLTKAEVMFGDINDDMLTGITKVLADTDFDDETFTGLVLGQSVVFVLTEIDGDPLPAGGITIDAIAVKASDLADVLITILSLAPADGTTNLWTTFAEQIGLADANKMATTTSQPMPAEPARTDGAKQEHQMAVDISDTGDGDTTKAELEDAA